MKNRTICLSCGKVTKKEEKFCRAQCFKNFCDRHREYRLKPGLVGKNE